MSQPQSGKLELIPLGQIRPSATNPRKKYDERKFDELKQSIAQSGITVPLTVRILGFAAGEKKEPRYELVAGYRRFLAAKDLKLAEVPCIVHELVSDATARDWQMIENLQREDMHPMEEAAGYRDMIAAAKANNLTLTQSALALRLGKSEKHVAERLALLKLIAAGATLFSRGDITLGHALQIAKLEPADQEKAVRWLIDPSNSRSSLPLERLVSNDAGPENKYLKSWREREEKERAKLSPDDRAKAEAKDDSRDRVEVTATEKALRGWIRANCLLRLDGVPWNLDDAFADEKPKHPAIIGACDGCAYRTLTNPALFSDVAGEQDMCTHPPCYQAKQKACAQRFSIQAKAEARPFVKLSVSESHRPVMVKDGMTLKQGQWVEIGKRKCGASVTGVFVDGPRAGQSQEVCPDQTCKVHKHTVERAQPAGSGSRGESYAEQQKREREKREALVVPERPIRKAVFDAVMAEVEVYDGLEFLIAQNVAARTAATLYTKGDTNQRMVRALVHSDIEDELEPEGWRIVQRNGMKQDRERLWSAAKHFGVDADAIAKRIEAEQKASVGPTSPRQGGGIKSSGGRASSTGVGAAAVTAAKKATKKKLTPAQQLARKAAERKKHAAAKKSPGLKPGASGGDNLGLKPQAPTEVKLPPAKAGRCRFCRCTDEHACDGGCSWVDEEHTVCNNEDCVAKMLEALGQVPPVDGKSAAAGERAGA